MTEDTPAYEKNLVELHSELIVRLANALTLVLVGRATAPFCDPAFEPLEEELRSALETAHQTLALDRVVARTVGDPDAPDRPGRVHE